MRTLFLIFILILTLILVITRIPCPDPDPYRFPYPYPNRFAYSYAYPLPHPYPCRIGHPGICYQCFHGHGGRAFLFEHCVNVTAGRPEERRLLTGMHVVADITCSACGADLGWKYVSSRLGEI